MEPEPLLPVAPADADMTIDYDQPQQAVAGAGDDAMGIEAVPAATATDDDASLVSTVAEITQPDAAEDTEAVMRDEGDVVPHKHETEIVMIEEEAAPTAADDVPFSTAEDQASAVAIVTEEILEVPASAATATALPDSVPDAAGPALSTVEVPIPEEDFATAQTINEEAPTAGITAVNEAVTTDTRVASDGDDGTAAGDDEQAKMSLAEKSAAAAGQPAVGGDTVADPQGREQAEAVEATQTAQPEPVGESVPPLFALATEKLSEQLPAAEIPTEAAPAVAGDAPNARPPVDKDPLLQVQLPADLFPEPEASTSAARLAPGVLLTCGGTMYCLFRQLRLANDSSIDQDEEGRDHDDGDESHSDEVDAPLVLAAMAQHALYYEPVDKLVQSLRESLPELNGETDELVLDFEDLGITLGEDNCYAREVSLFDFDRLQLGCQIPNRLHARIYAQPRFASGFNALAQHIASTYTSVSDSSHVDAEEGGDEVEQEGEAPGEDDDLREDDGEEEEGAGVADDYDGPDSQLPALSASGGEEGEEPDEVEGEDDDDENDDFDLESALAQLDQDSIVAVVEGAQEDLLLDSAAVAENDAATAADAGEEGADEDAEEAGGGEQALVAAAADVGRDDQSWQNIETEEVVEAVGASVEVEERAGGGSGRATAGEGGEARGEEGEVVEVEVEVEVENEPVPSEATLAALGSNEVDTSRPVEEGETASLVEAVAEAEPVALEVVEPAPAETLEADTAPQENTSVPEPGEQAEPEDGEAVADPSDVVIDYDEAFEPTMAAPPVADVDGDVAAAAAATTEGNATNGVAEAEAPLSPKRSRSFDAVEGREDADEDLAADAKRPRLSEAEVAGPTATATA
ncbi:hypothetical protein JCM3774_004791 [Rhodotorula dairenensis]